MTAIIVPRLNRIPVVKKIINCVLISFLILHLQAQTNTSVSRIITDSRTGEALQGASISLYKSGQVEGIISNKEGKFIIAANKEYDSIKISMVGFHSRVFYSSDVAKKIPTNVKLEESASILAEVLVKPPVAIEIIKQAIAKISFFQPKIFFHRMYPANFP